MVSWYDERQIGRDITTCVSVCIDQQGCQSNTMIEYTQMLVNAEKFPCHH